MKLLVSIFCYLVTFATLAQELTLPPVGDNQKAEVSQWIGLVKVTITYHSPDVHDPAGADRKGHIWGELVPFGFNDEGFGPSKAIPWRAGANESTTISFSHDVKINGKDVKSGTYALFLDVEKEGNWNWIISSNIGWGSYQYDPKFDVVRIPSPTEDVPRTEWLTYGFEDRQPNSTKAFLQWENKKAAFKIEVPNVTLLYVDQIRKDLQGWAGFTYSNWMQAAQFCVRNKINLDEALTWADRAISEPFRGVSGGKQEFATYQTKAMVLFAMNKPNEAMAVMEKALTLPEVTAQSYFQYTRSLIRNGEKERSFEIANRLVKSYPKEKYWTRLAMAFSYTALDDRKKAIENWEEAIRNIPEDQKGYLVYWNEEVRKLKAKN